MPNCEYRRSTYNGYKEVIIIGNGPSGLCTSYMLSGHWPYYNKNKVFDEYLQMRLNSIDQNVSLVEQDLEFLSDGLEGRTRNPVALLFDNLKNPGSDLGYQLDSCIEWKYDSNKEIDHIVIGKTQPGGSWNTFDGDQLTISLSRWMELPDFDFNEFKKEITKNNYTVLQERATANDVRDYYQFYVKKKNLEKYMLNNATVTNVRKIVPTFLCIKTNSNIFGNYDFSENEYWEVSGVVDSGEKYEFRFICKHLILAVGATGLNNELHVKGENYPFVLRTTHDLEEQLRINRRKFYKRPLLVVGGGLSAADCILLANKYRIKIVHVIRRSVYDKNIIYQKLSKVLYPDYHSVYNKMLQYKQQIEQNHLYEDEYYTLYDEYQVKYFKPNHSCIIQSNKCDNEKEIHFSYACVLIGYKINLNFLPDEMNKCLTFNGAKEIDTKDNPIYINQYTYETMSYKNLFAMGPLVGDAFVRFGIGGSLAITNHLCKLKSIMKS